MRPPSVNSPSFSPDIDKSSPVAPDSVPPHAHAPPPVLSPASFRELFPCAVTSSGKRKPPYSDDAIAARLQVLFDADFQAAILDFWELHLSLVNSGYYGDACSAPKTSSMSSFSQLSSRSVFSSSTPFNLALDPPPPGSPLLPKYSYLQMCQKLFLLMVPRPPDDEDDAAAHAAFSAARVEAAEADWRADSARGRKKRGAKEEGRGADVEGGEAAGEEDLMTLSQFIAAWFDLADTWLPKCDKGMYSDFVRRCFGSLTAFREVAPSVGEEESILRREWAYDEDIEFDELAFGDILGGSEEEVEERRARRAGRLNRLYEGHGSEFGEGSLDDLDGLFRGKFNFRSVAPFSRKKADDLILSIYDMRIAGFKVDRQFRPFTRSGTSRLRSPSPSPSQQSDDGSPALSPLSPSEPPARNIPQSLREFVVHFAKVTWGELSVTVLTAVKRLIVACHLYEESPRVTLFKTFFEPSASAKESLLGGFDDNTPRFDCYTIMLAKLFPSVRLVSHFPRKIKEHGLVFVEKTTFFQALNKAAGHCPLEAISYKSVHLQVLDRVFYRGPETHHYVRALSDEGRVIYNENAKQAAVVEARFNETANKGGTRKDRVKISALPSYFDLEAFSPLCAGVWDTHVIYKALHSQCTACYMLQYCIRRWRRRKAQKLQLLALEAEKRARFEQIKKADQEKLNVKSQRNAVLKSENSAKWEKNRASAFHCDVEDVDDKPPLGRPLSALSPANSKKSQMMSPEQREGLLGEQLDTSPSKQSQASLSVSGRFGSNTSSSPLEFLFKKGDDLESSDMERLDQGEDEDRIRAEDLAPHLNSLLSSPPSRAAQAIPENCISFSRPLDVQQRPAIKSNYQRPGSVEQRGAQRGGQRWEQVGDVGGEQFSLPARPSTQSPSGLSTGTGRPLSQQRSIVPASDVRFGRNVSALVEKASGGAAETLVNNTIKDIGGNATALDGRPASTIGKAKQEPQAFPFSFELVGRSFGGEVESINTFNFAPASAFCAGISGNSGAYGGGQLSRGVRNLSSANDRSKPINAAVGRGNTKLYVQASPLEMTGGWQNVFASAARPHTTVGGKGGKTEGQKSAEASGRQAKREVQLQPFLLVQPIFKAGEDNIKHSIIANKLYNPINMASYY